MGKFFHGPQYVVIAGDNQQFFELALGGPDCSFSGVAASVCSILVQVDAAFEQVRLDPHDTAYLASRGGRMDAGNQQPACRVLLQEVNRRGDAFRTAGQYDDAISGRILLPFYRCRFLPESDKATCNHNQSTQGNKQSPQPQAVRPAQLLIGLSLIDTIALVCIHATLETLPGSPVNIAPNP